MSKMCCKDEEECVRRESYGLQRNATLALPMQRTCTEISTKAVMRGFFAMSARLRPARSSSHPVRGVRGATLCVMHGLASTIFARIALD